MPDSLTFRERVTPEVAEPAKAPVQPVEIGVAENPNANPLKDSADTITDLAIWEGENGKKYVNEYFNTHNLSHEFTIKMPTGEIDKYIREELAERGFENTISNYKEVLAEIEMEIGSSKLQLFKRFGKLTGYIRAMRKLKAAKALKQKYIESADPSVFS